MYGLEAKNIRKEDAEISIEMARKYFESVRKLIRL
jgi:HEPN domain-containing protein